MNFLQLNAIFVAVALLVVLLALRRSSNQRTVVLSVAAALVVMVALTAVFDNVMIASGLFDYAGHALHGLRVGLAPIEDFAYPLAAAMLLPGLWLVSTRRGKP